GELRIETRAFGDAARDDRRNRSSEGEQEKELGELIAALLRQRGAAAEEVDPIGDAVADEEISDGGHREVSENFDQRIDLILAPHGAQLQKRKASMHGEHHHCAQQDEQDVTACLQIFHGLPSSFGSEMLAAASF